jgi:hypothetical protein
MAIDTLERQKLLVAQSKKLEASGKGDQCHNPSLRLKSLDNYHQLKVMNISYTIF